MWIFNVNVKDIERYSMVRFLIVGYARDLKDFSFFLILHVPLVDNIKTTAFIFQMIV